MPSITITKCEEITKCEDAKPDDVCKEFFVVGDVDGAPFAVTVLPSCGEYDYDQYPQSRLGEDDEPLQTAIGQYFEDNNIDVGRVGR